MESWLGKNDIEMYSTHNEGKSVVAERFIRTLEIELTLVQKLTTKIGNIVRISKYKNIFAKCYTPNWPEEVFMVKVASVVNLKLVFMD